MSEQDLVWGTKQGKVSVWKKPLLTTMNFVIKALATSVGDLDETPDSWLMTDSALAAIAFHRVNSTWKTAFK